MNATELAKLTIKELKAIAQAKGIEVIGDKRSKATWVLAIETFLTEQPTIETIETFLTEQPTIETIESPFELANESDSIDSLHPTLEPNSQVSEQTAPIPTRGASARTLQKERSRNSTHTHAGASTVALVAVLAFSVAFLVIKTGLTSILWVIAALSPLALGLWRYLVPDPKHQDWIDYFPLPIG
ncbi:hypothetical protein [Chamaesiphon sp. VAR_48_metabat_403]|uniref:hypothetical protein n=1 Tax=Chamaesiphon sp. VAR_48_metabat_403 TaxID=2964700 RepID=UPI00286DF851|nr:hypothetical protein [Chamaesiphon sp. VAR_48_metabat_403]